ncbi:hypothetical protein RRF57_013406 [Xylaria bambusicola]|uniref:Uncharacterized protein n=1 Tax=Xylaria bambusicola TaxID=326684 RepID=A0AAN7V1P2_9PEZI
MHRAFILAPVWVISLLSGTHASFKQAYPSIMKDIYYTISTHHEIFCGPTQKLGATQQQTVYVTKTISSTLTNTITPTRMVAQYVTLTSTATSDDDDMAPTDASWYVDEPRSNCYWLAVHELDKAYNLYNLTSELEVTALRGLVSQATESHQRLEQIAEQKPEQAERMNALDEALYYLVDTPLGNACDVFLNLTKQLIRHGSLTPREKRDEDIGVFFDAALLKLENNTQESRSESAPGVLLDGATEALRLVLDIYTDPLCSDADCSWAARIILELSQTADGLRDILKERLKLTKSKTLAGNSKGGSVSSMLWNMGLVLGLYGIVKVLVRLTANG